MGRFTNICHHQRYFSMQRWSLSTPEHMIWWGLFGNWNQVSKISFACETSLTSWYKGFSKSCLISCCAYQALRKFPRWNKLWHKWSSAIEKTKDKKDLNPKNVFRFVFRPKWNGSSSSELSTFCFIKRGTVTAIQSYQMDRCNAFYFDPGNAW